MKNFLFKTLAVTCGLAFVTGAFYATAATTQCENLVAMSILVVGLIGFTYSTDKLGIKM